MPPPKQACELLLNTQINVIKILNRIREIRKKIKEGIDLKTKLRYGTVNLLDTIGAETVSAISSVAASTARAMLGSVSSMASTLMESILSSLLKILLAHPTAIFSLVAIPHSQAIKAVYRERTLLRRAKENLRTILRIILKWTRGFGGTQYYNQMVEALPYIQQAIAQSVSLLKELEGFDEDGNVPNARLNESKYRFMQQNIAKAIEITKPISFIDQRAQITKHVEASREQYYQQEADRINADYDKMLATLFSEYQQDMIRINQQEDGLAKATWLEAARTEYATKRNILDAGRKEELNKASFRAAAKATVDKNAYIKAASGIVGSFVDDMQVLGANLKEFVQNTSDAFIAYKRSQNLCHSIYRIRDLITSLINQIIEVLRRSNAASAQVAISALEKAQAMLIITKEDFEEAVRRFESTSEKISSMELSTTVVKGHGLLNTADALMKSTITDSLIDLINSDDILQVANERFEEFYKQLEGISDWDGVFEAGVSKWATNPSSAAISPYPKMIADATSILAKVPVLALSNNSEDRIEITAIIRSVNSTFNTLFAHNSEVRGVLASYSPYMTSDGGNLLRILSNAGLVTNFATTLSLAALAADIVVASGGDPFDDNIPTYGNCRRYYPELYTGADAAEVAAFDRANLPGHTTDLNFQSKVEETEHMTLRTKRFFMDADFNPGLTDDVFRDPNTDVT